jgi:SEC-C motif-containing protein
LSTYHREPTQPISKSKGVNSSEEYLNKLCNSTFLSLWSYAGIFRDQGVSQTGIGKELCDLLIVFEDHIIIFSDKYCEFPDTGNLRLDWNRWFRRAIQKSADQIWGAERWIKSFPDRLFLNRACTQRFPINFPEPEKAQFHRIVVAHGVSQRCKRELGGSGSLMIDSNLIGDMHCDLNNSPFTVGNIDPNKGYVHVLDDTSLDIVLNTLDTITDFVAYLTKKDILFSGDLRVIAVGEEELLALYLQNMNENQEHDFVIPSDIDVIGVPEGHWSDFVNHPQRKAQIEANKISYAWDDLIEVYNTHLLGGTRYSYTHSEVRDAEKIHRFLARESRTRRRMLARLLIELIEHTPKTHRGTRVVLPSHDGDPYYVFLVLPELASVPYEEYREVRAKFLEACCEVVKANYPDALDIVGIATEVGRKDEGSEDLCWLDAREWDEKSNSEALSLQRDLGLFQEVKFFRGTEQEYPTLVKQEQDFKLSKNPRNKPCPCGSGKKYKYCCLRKQRQT